MTACFMIQPFLKLYNCQDIQYYGFIVYFCRLALKLAMIMKNQMLRPMMSVQEIYGHSVHLAVLRNMVCYKPNTSIYNLLFLNLFQEVAVLMMI